MAVDETKLKLCGEQLYVWVAIDRVIGWVMATTPPPAPLEDISSETTKEASAGTGEDETAKKAVSSLF